MSLTKNQKEIFDYICQYQKIHGLAPTQKEIKEHFCLKSFGSVQRYIKYLVNAGLISSDWNARRGLKIVEEEKKEIGLEIPLLGLVAAGNPIEAIENPAETIAIPPHLVQNGHQHFALTVKGDSMIEDGILENDIIICRYTTDAKQGETVVAVINGEATVKHFFRKNDTIELHPANSRLRPIIVEAGDFRVVGKVVGLLRSY